MDPTINFFRKIRFPAGQEQFQDKRVTVWHIKPFVRVYMHLHVLAFLCVLLEILQLQEIGFPCWELIHFCNFQKVLDKSLITILFLLSTCNGNTYLFKQYYDIPYIKLVITDYFSL